MANETLIAEKLAELCFIDMLLAKFLATGIALI
jgi:hypothetical protein